MGIARRVSLCHMISTTYVLGAGLKTEGRLSVPDVNSFRTRVGPP